MRIEILPNFISADEANILNNFVLENIKKGNFSEGKTSRCENPPMAQMVSRFNPEIEFPKIVLDLQEKIINLLNLKQTDIHTKFHPTGVVVNCSFKGAKVVPHKDPTQGNLSLLRCNIISSASELGGDLIVENRQFNVPELGIYFCLVSEHEHQITRVEGYTPRIVWQFGFNVNAEDWNSGKIKVNNVSVS